MDFHAATDGEKPPAAWADTCMQPSGVTLTSLSISVIVVHSVSCGLMQLSQAGADMLHIAEEQLEASRCLPEWAHFSRRVLWLLPLAIFHGHTLSLQLTDLAVGTHMEPKQPSDELIWPYLEHYPAPHAAHTLLNSTVAGEQGHVNEPTFLGGGCAPLSLFSSWAASVTAICCSERS